MSIGLHRHMGLNAVPAEIKHRRKDQTKKVPLGTPAAVKAKPF
jgi:hypothetical protein